MSSNKRTLSRTGVSDPVTLRALTNAFSRNMPAKLRTQMTLSAHDRHVLLLKSLACNDANALSTLPTAHDILRSTGMTSKTEMSLLRSSMIHSERNRFHMIREHTRPHLTQMINRQAIGNRADKHLIGNTMCSILPAGVLKLTIPSSIFSSQPQPTVTRGVHLRPESQSVLCGHLIRPANVLQHTCTVLGSDA